MNSLSVYQANLELDLGSKILYKGRGFQFQLKMHIRIHSTKWSLHSSCIPILTHHGYLSNIVRTYMYSMLIDAYIKRLMCFSDSQKFFLFLT